MGRAEPGRAPGVRSWGVRERLAAPLIPRPGGALLRAAELAGLRRSRERDVGSEDPLTVPRPGQKTLQVSGASGHLLVACRPCIQLPP